MSEYQYWSSKSSNRSGALSAVVRRAESHEAPSAVVSVY